MEAEEELKKRAKATIRDYFCTQRFKLLGSYIKLLRKMEEPEGLKKLFNKLESELIEEMDKIGVHQSEVKGKNES